MPRVKLAVGGWFGASCAIAAVLWACSGKDNDLFSNPSRGGQTSTGGSGTAGDGISGGTSGNGGTPSGGSSGSSNGGVATGGMQTGGTAGEGGAAAESGTDSGGTATGGKGGTGLTSGAGGAGTSGNGGASASGGIGMGGAGLGGTGMGGAGSGGIGSGGASNGGAGGGPPGGCGDDDDCDDDRWCKKSSCNGRGSCEPYGDYCVGADAVFDPVCGCDGITYWNTCTIEHEGFNIASSGECTGNNRPTCTRDDGGNSCPPREHAHCYRPVEVCGDPSPEEGFCWVLPTECPENEPQTERYCGGTDGQARCIGLCEVIDAENSFRRDSPTCD
jgi:hypothetical protein